MGSFFGALRAAEAMQRQLARQQLADRYHAEIARAHQEVSLIAVRAAFKKREPQGKQCSGCGSRQYVTHNAQVICAYCRSWA